MSHPYHHAVSSAKRFGGLPEIYEPIHSWFDSTKSGFAHFTHRAILHNSFGCFLAEQLFGVTIDNGAGKRVPVRLIAEQHIREDLGWVPSIQDWLSNINATDWMKRGVANAKDNSDIPITHQIAIILSPDEAKRYYENPQCTSVISAIQSQIIQQLAQQENL